MVNKKMNVALCPDRQAAPLYFTMLYYRELNLRAEEDRCSRLREELLTLREDLNKAYLSQDMLEQQKMESDGRIAQMEKSKGVIIK
jgi:hypothetical protein